MISIIPPLGRAAKLAEETSKLQTVVRLIDYIVISLLGISLRKLKASKPSPSPQSLTITHPKKKRSKKAKPEPKVVQQTNTTDQTNLKIQKLTKLKQKIGFTRRIFRWGVILKQILLLRTLFDISSINELSTNTCVTIFNTILFVIFLITDQFVLYYTADENQRLKGRFYIWSIKYGRIPTHFFGALKYFLVLWEGRGAGIEMMGVLLFTQNVLDLVMYLVVYLRGNWHGVIGGLGIVTSVMGLYKVY